MAVVLESKRLLMKEMEMKDLDFLAALYSDPKVMRFYPKLYSRKEIEAALDRQFFRYKLHGHGLWLLEDKALRQAVGILGIIMQSIDFKAEPEIGYLLHPQFWKNGYATEAGIATRDYAFNTLNYHHVISLIRPINLQSQAVARRLGMEISKRTKFMNLEHLVFRVDKAALFQESN